MAGHYRKMTSRERIEVVLTEKTTLILYYSMSSLQQKHIVVRYKPNVNWRKCILRSYAMRYLFCIYIHLRYHFLLVRSPHFLSHCHVLLAFPQSLFYILFLSFSSSIYYTYLLIDFHFSYSIHFVRPIHSFFLTTSL